MLSNERLLKGFRQYLLSERNLSKNTADSYQRDLQSFFDFLDKPVADVESVDVSDYIIERREHGLTVESTNRHLAAIRTFYKYMMKKGYVQLNPSENIEGGKRKQSLPQPVDYEDIELMFSLIDNLRDTVLLEILYGTGARRFEVAELKVKDVNFNRGYIKFLGKGSKERIVPINKAALALIKELADQHNSKWLFPSRKNKAKPISRRRINEIVQYWVKKAGLEDKNITPHKFRHSFCSHLYQNGADLKTIQDLAGHSKADTTQVYTKVSNKRNFSEYEQFHPRSQRT